jgi:hypothetical protein
VRRAPRHVRACRRDFSSEYEQLLRDLDIVRDWKPDIVILDEAQRIKNWATKTALTVKRLDPPYRLVLTGTPMENRLDELASIVEWVDDLALEPKWRLARGTPRRSTARQGRRARNLDTYGRGSPPAWSGASVMRCWRNYRHGPTPGSRSR